MKHLLTKINKDQKASEYLIFVSQNLESHLDAFKNTSVFKSIYFFDEEVSRQFTELVTTKQMGDFIYKQIMQIYSTHKFSHVLFLNLNLFLLHYGVLNPFKKLPFTFSGIFFNSPYRLRNTKAKRKLVWKRELVLKILAYNTNCTGVFLLNDRRGAAFYNKWSSKIKFVVDPIIINPSSSLDIYEEHKISKVLLSFTHIGYLGSYKGTSDIINSLKTIKEKVKQKSHFFFIGKMKKELQYEIEQLNTNNPSHSIVSVRNEFISDEDFSAYIQQSDVILIANKNVESSSGIVNHCLANNKVVIAPNEGYYKEAFEKYKGVVLYGKTFVLNKAISYVYKNYNQLKIQSQKFDSLQFSNENSQENFGETLLNSK